MPGARFPEAQECGLSDKDSQAASYCLPFLHPCNQSLTLVSGAGSPDTSDRPGNSWNQFYPLSCSEVLGGDALRDICALTIWHSCHQSRLLLQSLGKS